MLVCLLIKEFEEVTDDFDKVYKQITRKNASRNPKKIRQCEHHLVYVYNELIALGKVVYNYNDSELIQYVRSKTIDIRDDAIS